LGREGIAWGIYGCRVYFFFDFEFEWRWARLFRMAHAPRGCGGHVGLGSFVGV
jgi:hypothetical protein